MIGWGAEHGRQAVEDDREHVHEDTSEGVYTTKTIR
jgi:hypothetical protein